MPSLCIPGQGNGESRTWNVLCHTTAAHQTANLPRSTTVDAGFCGQHVLSRGHARSRREPNPPCPHAARIPPRHKSYLPKLSRPGFDGAGDLPKGVLYGILLPPGKSVVAQTPQGAVALNVVPVEPRVHAKGPLVYGVFSALPSELTVLGANGSTLYTENLQAKATEAVQFCEGYTEPW